jgi:hypothetical protein
MVGLGITMEDMDEMIKMLASAPEEQRRAMVRQRMDMFLSMPEENRVQAMRAMLLSIGKLSPEARKRLIKTRTEVVAGYDNDQRKQLLLSRMKSGMELPREVDTADMQAIEQVLPELPEDLRTNFIGTRQELMKAMGVSTATPAPQSGGRPVHHGQPMKLKGVFQKRFVCETCGFVQPVVRG